MPTGRRRPPNRADPSTLPPETPGGRFVKTAGEVAKLLGVSRRTVAFWIHQGAPPKRNGRYDVDAIEAWRGVVPVKAPSNASVPDDPAPVDQVSPANIAIQRQEWALRKERAVAKQQELELAKLEGTLIEAEVPAREYAAHITTARTLLEQLPDAILGLLPSITGPTRKSVRKRIELKIGDIIRAMRGDLEDR